MSFPLTSDQQRTCAGSAWLFLPFSLSTPTKKRGGWKTSATHATLSKASSGRSGACFSFFAEILHYVYESARARRTQRGMENVTGEKEENTYQDWRVAQASRHAKWTGINRLTKCSSVFVIAALSLAQHRCPADERCKTTFIGSIYECRLAGTITDKNRQWYEYVRRETFLLQHTHTRARVLIQTAERRRQLCAD